jgi:hypothetical protein
MLGLGLFLCTSFALSRQALGPFFAFSSVVLVKQEQCYQIAVAVVVPYIYLVSSQLAKAEESEQ